MKKIHIAILILIAILGFAGADYLINIPKQSDAVTVESQDSNPNLTQALLEANPATLGYQIVKRNRTTQIFETIDLSELADVRVYRNQVESSEPESNRVTVFEIQGPLGQGGLSYLNIKLKAKDQLSATESINETNEFGHGSFYYNDINSPNTSFLMVQIGDNMFGFEFNKNDPKGFKTVQTLIDSARLGIAA